MYNHDAVSHTNFNPNENILAEVGIGKHIIMSCVGHHSIHIRLVIFDGNIFFV